MKVYLFEKQSGVFLGEDFVAGQADREEDGETSIAPPETGPGEVAVFNRAGRCWQVVSVDRWLKIVREEV